MQVKSIYIHIPFCNKICSYCDFTKLYYNKKYIDDYLNSLSYEINKYYKNEILDTLYVGGGTPSSLDTLELKKLFSILKKLKLNANYEFTFECNVESLNEEKLKLLYEMGVNRLSIGVQTINEKFLKYLNRFHSKEKVVEIINAAKKIGFKNINIDLIYAIPNQTLDDLKYDLDFFINLNINHISTYSLMIEPHTKLFINNEKSIEEDLDYEMYQYICSYFKKNGFKHYEVSNFAKNGYESRHNLTYWNNSYYYGFGLSASGYIDDIRYTNTLNLNAYLSKDYARTVDLIDTKINMENEMILGLRKLEGVNKEKFKLKFGKNINEVFNIDNLIKDKKLIDENGYIKINEKYFYLQNQILREFII